MSSAIDLHTHSTASDGTDSPGQLVRAAAETGLEVVALTDHDTTSGWAEAADVARESGIRLVRGAELSVSHHGYSVHLLAYLFDPEATELREHRRAIRSARLDRARRMVGLLARDFPITWEDVAAQTTEGASVGRPHIADALVAAGVVGHRDEAFAAMLSGSGPYYVPHYSMPAATAVRLVREAGGVPVIAHPGAALRGRVLPDVAIAELVPLGLAGLEADHRDHDDAARRRVRALADRLGILSTGSSDYHGTGKHNLLGENTTARSVYDALVAQGSGVPVV